MAGIEVTPVDERDGSWEDHGPRFRVYLHSSGDGSVGGATATSDVTGADILQVIDWAQKQVGADQTYAIALVGDVRAGAWDLPVVERGLTWLVGMDGNDTAMNALEADRQQRMLTRRTAPVGVPLADRMPDGVPAPHGD